MLKLLLSCELLSLALLLPLSGLLASRSAAYESYYMMGVNSYLDNNWDDCVEYLEDAISAYHLWTDNVIRCRKLCKERTGFDMEIFLSNMILSEAAYVDEVLATHCLIKCRKKLLGDFDLVSMLETREAFQQRKPYDYLQLCYFKLGRLKDAANAASTVLAVQSYHEVMKENLMFYLTDLGVHYVPLDLESRDYEQAYNEGLVAYGLKNFEESIRIFEFGLSRFFDALEDCRLSCEDPYSEGLHVDFASLIANAYTYSLRCKRRCYLSLSNFIEVEDSFRDYVKSVLHFLQVSYDKTGDLHQTCQSIETSLYLDPENNVYTRNKNYVLTLPGVRIDIFTLRQDVKEVYDREVAEKRLLEAIDEIFVIMDKGDFGLSIGNISSTSSRAGMEDYDVPLIDNSEKQRDIVLTRNGINLKGDSRFVADGLLTPLQCDQLMWVSKQGSVEGDGYKKAKDHHTEYEKFGGMSISRLSLLTHTGAIDPALFQLVLNVTEEAKEYLSSYLKLDGSLYFSYTHLVCREAKIDMVDGRSSGDMSHEVHADNCILQPDSQCHAVPPAYTHRDYSSILYLNEDFEGGEFIFTKDMTGRTYESKVKPKCGRLVGFSAGKEDSHGVRGVFRGTRCAISMWFTFDKRFKEVERDLAYDLLERMKRRKVL